jgi:thymidylate synthase (FAD)
MSVALSRELLEHRIASHTAKSTRYVSQAKELNVYYPPKLQSNDTLSKKYITHIVKTHTLYKEIEEAIDRESARYVLPMGLLCTYTWTINARSLINFLRLRLCVLAAPEMQELAQGVYHLVNEVYPEIFENIGCRGSQYKICPEPKGRSCGKYNVRSS